MAKSGCRDAAGKAHRQKFAKRVQMGEHHIAWVEAEIDRVFGKDNGSARNIAPGRMISNAAY
jgi:hypothetical protein